MKIWLALAFEQILANITENDVGCRNVDKIFDEIGVLSNRPDCHFICLFGTDCLQQNRVTSKYVFRRFGFFACARAVCFTVKDIIAYAMGNR